MPVVTLSELLEQPTVSAFLRGVVAGGRYANAYLFHGPAGIGKGTAALAFARALLCERAGGARAREADLFGGAAAPPERLDDACGACPACAKSALLQHPDLRFLFPVSAEDQKLDDTIAETMAAWREDPFYVFAYEKAASIRLATTRELLKELAFKPYEAERRVVVVRDADRMREDQYSALLKSIEEPGGSTVWVLTTSRPARLPATIRSRCQRIRFHPLAERVIERFLEERIGSRPTDARMLAALSCGSLARALVLREMLPPPAPPGPKSAQSRPPTPTEMRDQALNLVRPALSGDSAGLWMAVQGLTRFGKRETLRRLVEFQMLWLRDLLRARYGAPREDLVNRDREAEIRREAEHVDATEIRRRLMVLEEALRMIEGNVTPDLALFSAMTRIAEPRLQTAPWPRYDTARWDY